MSVRRCAAPRCPAGRDGRAFRACTFEPATGDRGDRRGPRASRARVPHRPRHTRQPRRVKDAERRLEQRRRGVDRPARPRRARCRANWLGTSRIGGRELPDGAADHRRRMHALRGRTDRRCDSRDCYPPARPVLNHVSTTSKDDAGAAMMRVSGPEAVMTGTSPSVTRQPPTITSGASCRCRISIGRSRGRVGRWRLFADGIRRSRHLQPAARESGPRR